MNRRVRELAEQAWDSLIDELGDVVDENGRLNWNFLHAYDKKFAESIVQECVEVVKWTPSQFPNDEYVKNIKEHFGVQ